MMKLRALVSLGLAVGMALLCASCGEEDDTPDYVYLKPTIAWYGVDHYTADDELIDAGYYFSVKVSKDNMTKYYGRASTTLGSTDVMADTLNSGTSYESYLFWCQMDYMFISENSIPLVISFLRGTDFEIDLGRIDLPVIDELTGWSTVVHSGTLDLTVSDMGSFSEISVSITDGFNVRTLRFVGVGSATVDLTGFYSTCTATITAEEQSLGESYHKSGSPTLQVVNAVGFRDQVTLISR